jgi:predicted RNA-binding protein with TRAM domain
MQTKSCAGTEWYRPVPEGEHAAKTGAGVYQTDGAVVFMMRDTQTGEVVPCKITAAALSRLAGRAGVRLEDAFDENRLTIDAIAGRMYDAGQTRPVLDEADV